MEDTAKIATVMRFVIDAGLVIAALVVCASLNHHHEEGTSHSPVVFQVYDLRAYDRVDSLHEYFQDNVLGKALCTPGAGCSGDIVSSATLLAGVQTHTGCTPSAGVVRAPMCATCVDDLVPKIWTAGDALADNTFHAADKADVAALKKLRRGLEACIARTGGARTVYAGHSINPWALLTFWCGLAMVFSTAKLLVAYWQSSGGNLIITALTLLVIGGTATAFGLLASNASSFAWYFGVGQLILICGIPYLVYTHSGADVFPAMFGIFMIAAAPCVAFIVFAFHGWLEHDMLNFGASVLTLFFAVSLLSDVCSVIWSKAEQERNAKHTHLHVFAVFLLGGTVFLLCTAQLPAAPPAAKLSGTLLFALLGAFLVVYTVAPSILFQMRQAGPTQATMYKELAESTLRILFFAVMMYYANHGIAR